ncbi:hypothetical protein N9C97_05195 [Candidatus Pelagibacter sp.]|nr:hypothetical protein [Candidatus Pelagibacter sp.]
MKNYSGKQLVSARTKAGYETRDSFYQNLKVYLEKQKRENELPHYKTIQRMEKENKFSNKSIKLICEFLSISEDDLIEKNKNSEKLNNKKNEVPIFDNAFSRPFIVENSKQIKNLITKSNKRIILFDYNTDDLSQNQDKGIGQLFTLIDNYASNQQDTLEIVSNHNFNSTNALKTNEELQKVNNLDYCLKMLKKGYGWVNDYEFDNLDDELEFLSNENELHKDNKKINPLYLYANSYDYTTYWPYPEYLYDKYMLTNEEKPFLNDIYYPKNESFYEYGNYEPGDMPKNFNIQNDENYRLTPVLMNYTIFIITSEEIDIIYHPNKLQKIIEKETGDIIYGAPEENKEYLFGKYYNGPYKKVLQDVQNDNRIAKNYLDSDDFKIIYGKSKSLEESMAKMVSREMGKTVQLEVLDNIIDEKNKNNDKKKY